MKRAYIFTIAAILLILIGVVFFYDYRQINSYPATAWTQDVTGDCAVVLTGGAGRVREGFDLLALGAVRKLIISGVHPKAQLREIFPQRPFYPSIDESDIVLERRSTTTYGNVHQTLPLAEALRCRSLVIITSRVHMYRAAKTFMGAKSEGIKLIPRAIAASPSEDERVEAVTETLKSIFYSLWAY